MRHGTTARGKAETSATARGSTEKPEMAFQEFDCRWEDGGVRSFGNLLLPKEPVGERDARKTDGLVGSTQAEFDS